MFSGTDHIIGLRAVSSICIAVAFASIAIAQPSVGPQVRVDNGGATFAANETSSAALESSPGHVVATWNDYRQAGFIRMGVSFSDDGGLTWSDFLLRPPAANQTDVEGDPMTARDDRTGSLWVGAIAFSDPNGGVFVARKDSGSPSFNAPVMARVSGSADKGWMAAGPLPGNPNSTRLYIAYNEGLLWSDDLGNTWSGPSSIDTGLGFLPRVGPNGELYIVYWDYLDGVRMVRSLNGGVSYDLSVTVAIRMDVWGIDGSRFPGSYRVPPIQTFAVDPNNGNLYVVYYDTTSIVGGSSNVDLYFTRSVDKGATWTSPSVINGDTFPPGDQFFPWLEVDQNGRLHVVFNDTRGLSTDDSASFALINAMYAWSDDAGDSWQEQTLTPAPFNSEDDGRPNPPAFIGDYLGMGVGGAAVYPCYLSNQNGDSDIFVHRIDQAVRGDMNCDGVLDPNDAEPFAQALVDPAGYAAAFPSCDIFHADMNNDLVLDGADIQPFVDDLLD